MEKYTLMMDWKTQYVEMSISSEFTTDQWLSNQNPRISFCRNKKAAAKIYIVRQKTKTKNLEVKQFWKEKQRWCHTTPRLSTKTNQEKG